MAWIYSLILVLLTLLCIPRITLFKSDVIKSRYFQIAYVLKIISGLIFIYIYSSYYQNRNEADVFKYFDDAKHIDRVKAQSSSDYWDLITGTGDTRFLTGKYLNNSRFWDNSPSLPFLNDNRFVIRFHALLLNISEGNIYLHLIVALMISFLGISLLFGFFKDQLNINEWWIFIVLFISPSILFWTSSILKENFLFLGLGLILTALIKRRAWKKIIYSLLGMFLIAVSKIYVLFILIPLLISWLWNENKKDVKIWLRYTVVSLLFLGLSLNLGYLNSSLDVLSILSNKQEEFICLASWTGAGSQVYIPSITENLMSYVKASPFALYNCLFRPLPWDMSGLISLPSVFESMLFILLIILSLSFRKKGNPNSLNLITFSFFFTLFMSLLIGLTSPVIGAIVRYRIVYQAFIFLALLSLVDFQLLLSLLKSRFKK